MAHLIKDNAYGFELELAKQDVENSMWAVIYKQPCRGLSFQFQEFGNKEVLGQGYSIYAHTSFPLHHGKQFGVLSFRGATGIAYITKKYDVIENPKNNAIGSHFNGYVNMGLQWYKYFDHWHIGTGIEFAHYSNAAMRVPNLGLNFPSVMFNIGYDIRSHQLEREVDVEIDSTGYLKRMAEEFRIFVIGGSKQNPVKFNPAHSRPILAIQGLYSLNIGERWKIDFGIDGIFNGGNQYHLDTSAYTIRRTLQFGAFVGASIHFYRAEFLTGFGAYFWSPVKPFGLLYNRLGFRYHFTDRFSGVVCIKAHLGIADYLEFGIGYRLWSNYKGL